MFYIIECGSAGFPCSWRTEHEKRPDALSEWAAHLEAKHRVLEPGSQTLGEFLERFVVEADHLPTRRHALKNKASIERTES